MSLLQSCAQSEKWELSGHETARSEQREQSGCETTQVVMSGYETAQSEWRVQSGYGTVDGVVEYMYCDVFYLFKKCISLVRD